MRLFYRSERETHVLQREAWERIGGDAVWRAESASLDGEEKADGYEVSSAHEYNNVFILRWSTVDIAKAQKTQLKVRNEVPKPLVHQGSFSNHSNMSDSASLGFSSEIRAESVQKSTRDLLKPPERITVATTSHNPAETQQPTRLPPKPIQLKMREPAKEEVSLPEPPKKQLLTARAFEPWVPEQQQSSKYVLYAFSSSITVSVWFFLFTGIHLTRTAKVPIRTAPTLRMSTRTPSPCSAIPFISRGMLMTTKDSILPFIAQVLRDRTMLLFGFLIFGSCFSWSRSFCIQIWHRSFRNFRWKCSSAT